MPIRPVALTTCHHPLGLRDRKKEQTRVELIRSAVDLFREKGYEATTVDDIVTITEPALQRRYGELVLSTERVLAEFFAEQWGAGAGIVRDPRCGS